jgi:prepilin-type N-terminal cleavage/methylation domain-containing protein
MRVRGVTLLEVMVAAAIIGVLASLAGVSISDAVLRASLAAEADTLDDLLRQGRLLARTERRCVVVVAADNRLDIVPLDHGLAPPADCEGGRAIDERNIGRTLSAGIRLGQARFFFDRAGGVVVPGGSTRAGGGVDLPVTVQAPGVPPRIFVLRLLAGTGAVSRLG